MVPGSRFEESDASMRERLVNSLSQSFPGSALSRALQCMQPESDSEDDDLKGDFLSSSCFAELRLEKGPIDSDDDLKPLSWLQDSNLLKNIACADEDSEDDQKENGDMLSGNHINQSHPPHVPYNPQKHINSKPPYSFSCLIFMAIEDSPHKRLPVKDIYSWILNHFPYFQHAPTGWKNSVRHNLSLNKCFKKVDKERGQVSYIYIVYRQDSVLVKVKTVLSPFKSAFVYRILFIVRTAFSPFRSAFVESFIFGPVNVQIVALSP